MADRDDSRRQHSRHERDKRHKRNDPSPPRSRHRSRDSPPPRIKRNRSRSNSPKLSPKKENPSSPAATAKEEPNFGYSGKLAAETNTFKGVVIKYSEPREARIPKTKWRFYEFKGDECINTLYIHRQSAYLIGRDRTITDFPVDHPSCSKQHAVLQYRLVDYTKEDGRKGKKVKPYIIDLGSTNGTYVNNNRIDPTRYVELKEKDMIKFGFSTREYILLHENSKDDSDDDQGADN